MKNISVLNLLLLVAIAGLGAAYWQSSRELAKSEVEVVRANEVADRFRNELGRIKVVDPDRYQVRRIYPQFGRTWSGDQRPPEDHQFRLYAPDASGFDLCYQIGELPESGFPKKYTSLFDHYRIQQQRGLRSEPAEIAILFRADFFNQNEGRFSLRVEPDYGTRESVSIASSGPISGEDLPWDQNTRRKKMIGLEPKFREDEPFDLDGRVLLIKNCVVEKDGQHRGFMMWIEPTKAEAQP